MAKRVWGGPRTPTVKHPKVDGARPEGKRFDMARLKPLCDQSGIKVASRANYGGAESKHPSYEIIVVSNGTFNPTNSNYEDKRRVNCFEMKMRFKPKADGVGEQEADADVKTAAKKGEFNSSYFWAVRPWYLAMGMFSDNLPRSPNVHIATDGAFGPDTAMDSPRSAFIANTFEHTTDSPSPAAECIKLWGNHFQIEKLQQKKASMRSKDFFFNESWNYKGVRYCMHNFKEHGKQMVKIKGRA